jgi:hypothetical protein
LRQAAATALAVGGRIIERTVDDVALGDEGLAVWSGYGEGGLVVERRYIIFVRVGAEIVSMEANRLPATAQAPAAVMAALMAKQVACLEATGWCEPVPMPAELRSATAGD